MHLHIICHRNSEFELKLLNFFRTYIIAVYKNRAVINLLSHLEDGQCASLDITGILVNLKVDHLSLLDQCH